MLKQIGSGFLWEKSVTIQLAEQLPKSRKDTETVNQRPVPFLKNHI